ncbi:MAG: reverse transcriptase domain-containing protein [Candidatus Arsenophonus phytopathogenicus]
MVGLKKAYVSIDRKTLFNTLEEYGVDRITRTLILNTLTNTRSKMKFRGEVSDSFNIETRVRQGDGLSPILFNRLLDKVILVWRIKNTPVQTLKGGPEVDVLAFGRFWESRKNKQ